MVNHEILSEDQAKALELITQFLTSSDETAFSLTGSAGTGKTYLMNILLQSIGYRVVLCAPTHKAKLVLEKTTHRECVTLHNLLALTPNLDIFDLDFRDLLFKTSGNKLGIPRKGLVICDEASMINDDLFNLLVQKCAERKTKILFVSDKKQLKPVKSSEISLVYNLKSQFELKQIFRQSLKSALTPILANLREYPEDNFQTSLGEEGSLFCLTDSQEFLSLYLKNIKKATSNSDILETKLTAYTNNRVDKYNELIKKVLFNTNKEYNRLEFITSCENFNFNNTNFYNSMDYIICNDPVKIDRKLPFLNLALPGYMIELYDSVFKKSEKVFILSKDISQDYIDCLAFKIEDLRFTAIEDKSRTRGLAWNRYYALFNSFTTPFELEVDGRLIKKKTFVPGYACTTHKLQGSSYNNIYVDMKNINTCIDEDVRRQLQYVALSRTKNNAFILQ